MDSFFTSSFKLETIAATWAARKRELRRERLETGRDLLLDTVKTHCMINRAQFYDELLDAASTARYRCNLHLPIWSYKAANVQCDPETYPTEIGRAQSLGQDAVINVGGETVRVQAVVHQTDFLQRLAEYFGPDFRVSVQKESALEGWSETWESHTRTLVLEYRPTRYVPRTPPPSPPPENPPPLLRPSIRTYQGEDAVQQAARDLFQDFNQTTCYCGYDHPKDE
jgi:hypothetical protein